MKTLSIMQDQFGHLNDVAVARELLAELTTEKGLSTIARRNRLYGAGQVVAWHARGVKDSESEFLNDWKALKKTTPFWSGASGPS
jgi:CHAD domain-containing protein